VQAGRIFADDISWIEAAGHQSKAKVLQRYTEIREPAIEMKDVRIRILGNAAVVTSAKSTPGKGSESGRSTDLFESAPADAVGSILMSWCTRRCRQLPSACS
jgi:hypothetical protein